MSHEICWELAVTSTGILSSIGKSSFMWDLESFISMNMGKRFKITSSSSRLDTSTWAVGGGCALDVESSPDMVTVSLSPWNGILSTSFALGTGGDGRIGAKKGVTASLEDEPFSPPIFYFFCWRPDFNGLNQFFLVFLMEVGSQIRDYFFFFFHFLNDRRHNRLNGLA